MPPPDADCGVTMNWDRLVREHGAVVFGTAWRILGHAADTEDVVQEVFIEAHRLQKTQAVKRWPGLLRRLATCRALDKLRQRKSIVSLNGLNLLESEPGPEEAAIEHELAGRLREALGQLPAREAHVFCLRYFEDQSYQQIAETLNINSNAVAQALHKARGKLESLLIEVTKEE